VVMTGFQSKKQVARIMPKPKVITPIPNYKIIDQALVDNEQWYTVRVYKTPIMSWLRNSDKKWQWEHSNNGVSGIRFDMHEKLFTLLALKWPPQ
jgi:hypothetical protein